MLADREWFCHSWVANFWSTAIQLNILHLKITLNVIESLIHWPLLVLLGPLFDHYKDEPSSCCWGWIVSMV